MRALARDLTATSPTPYERARTSRRTFDVLLHSRSSGAAGRARCGRLFLFELKRGYCDYFATSMVVLARAAGLPARMAVGYATGSYDPRSAHYVVVGTDAHSWPQVYFPGDGWIDFEPTSARPLIDRPADPLDLPDLPLGTPSEPLTAERTRAEGQRLGGILLLSMILIAVVAGWLLTDAWRLSRHAA